MKKCRGSVPTNLMLQEKKVGALEHIGDEVGSWSNGKINEISESVVSTFSLILCADKWKCEINEAVRFKEPSEACGQT